MKAVVLDKKGVISIRDMEFHETLGAQDVRVDIHAVGICGSDVHYYKEGAIGPFIVKEPMVLGHEASGIVTEIGSEVKHLKVGSRVCFEPGIPDWSSDESRHGYYNLDPAVRFWATPPIHGCLRESVVHPAALTYELPASLSMEEGALVEPVAIGIHAAEVADVKPGDYALVLGCGTIGLVTAVSALAAGCSTVVITDKLHEKLAVARLYKNLIAVEAEDALVREKKAEITRNRGFDIVFDATGNSHAIAQGIEHIAPHGRLILIGMPSAPVPIDIVRLQMKEVTLKTIFRYANDFSRALQLMGAGILDVKPMISKIFTFDQSVEAFELAAKQDPRLVKILISCR
ncbi:MAG: NAD(P)-dependent alcohol dehydrogenase [Sphaerochaetaceae bacterium]|jgi:D-xylulose reductase|nr:NAD(P)-dependent alcohol dehydrogenase [Sphaerochaetaceae bacterium]MDX9809010.1 NAD(P)-dependent alcohol dehydrogenase [Sphaerochaetaceae bacterium]NLV84387.1 NAD(P)-dependent alcohol dehydrogenase [Spirochaetales bacterium]